MVEEPKKGEEGVEETPEEVPETPPTPLVEKKEDKEPESQVPLSRFKEVIKQRNDAKEAQPQKDEIKTILKETLKELKEEETVQDKKDEDTVKAEIVELHKVYGEFDEDKLTKIIQDYGVYKEDGTVNWDRGMELLNRLEKAPAYNKPTPKLPESKGTDTPQVEAFKPTPGKTVGQVAEEAKKRHGLV